MTLRCLYAVMKVFTILIWKIQCFYRVRRNQIDLSIGKASESRERQGMRNRKELRACACVHMSPIWSHNLSGVPTGPARLSLAWRSLLGDIFCTLFPRVAFCHICHLMSFLRASNPLLPYARGWSSHVSLDHGTGAVAVCWWPAQAPQHLLQTWLWTVPWILHALPRGPPYPYRACGTGCLMLLSCFLSGIP